jgi:hypothetical protein
MKRAIALVEGTLGLAEINAEFERALGKLKDRKKFLDKQLQDLQVERGQLAERMNASLAEHFQSCGLLPADFDPKKHHFHFHNGSVVICDEDTPQNPIELIVEGFFRGPAS